MRKRTGLELQLGSQVALGRLVWRLQLSEENREGANLLFDDSHRFHESASRG